jgi:hypothetical protein
MLVHCKQAKCEGRPARDVTGWGKMATRHVDLAYRITLATPEITPGTGIAQSIAEGNGGGVHGLHSGPLSVLYWTGLQLV